MCAAVQLKKTMIPAGTHRVKKTLSRDKTRHIVLTSASAERVRLQRSPSTTTKTFAQLIIRQNGACLNEKQTHTALPPQMGPAQSHTHTDMHAHADRHRPSSTSLAIIRYSHPRIVAIICAFGDQQREVAVALRAKTALAAHQQVVVVVVVGQW